MKIVPRSHYGRVGPTSLMVGKKHLQVFTELSMKTNLEGPKVYSHLEHWHVQPRRQLNFFEETNILDTRLLQYDCFVLIVLNYASAGYMIAAEIQDISENVLQL